MVAPMNRGPAKLKPATPLASVPAHPDKISVIQRSMRCLVFGVIGAVPLLGVAVAMEAARLHHRVALETGERWRPERWLWAWMAELAVVTGVSLLYFVEPWILAGVWAGAVLFLGWRLRRLYGRTRPALWNPARAWLYWGGWLAWTNLMLLAQVLTSLVGAFTWLLCHRWL